MTDPDVTRSVVAYTRTPPAQRPGFRRRTSDLRFLAEIAL